MTKGFKHLLNDLHQLISDIRDSGGLLRKEDNMVERSTSTLDVDIRTGSVAGKVALNLGHPEDESNRSSGDKNVRVFTNAKTTGNEEEMSNASSQSNNKTMKAKPESYQGGKSSKIKIPLRSSSPKSMKTNIDYDRKKDTVSELSVSDISDVESECPEGRPTHFVEGQKSMDLQKV